MTFLVRTREPLCSLSLPLSLSLSPSLSLSLSLSFSSFDVFDVFVAISLSAWQCHESSETLNANKCMRYKGFVSTIFAQTVVFIQLNSLSSFSKRCYRGLACRAFVILSWFSLKSVAIFLHVRQHRNFSDQNSLSLALPASPSTPPSLSLSLSLSVFSHTLKLFSSC